MALGLGLVLTSTLLSPLITPVTLKLAQQMATSDYAQVWAKLEGSGTGVLLVLCVMLPSLAGMAARPAIGDAGFKSVKPILKLINSVVLFGLNYSNASVALPQMVAQPDWDFLAVTLVIVLAMCAFAFGSGWYLARLLRTDKAQRISLMFSLGMNNNGTGLVLASMTLADHAQKCCCRLFYTPSSNTWWREPWIPG